MKKRITKVLVLIIAIAMSISLFACDNANSDSSDNVPFIGENGNWWIGDQDTGISATGSDGADGNDGVDGKDGVDGQTPFVGENGNWWIGDQDTGISALGKDGADGKDGVNGADGSDGSDGKNGTDGKMTTTSFENWLDDKENSATAWREVGYYFNENAEKTAEFAEIFPDVVKKAYEMEMYSFDEVEMKLTIEMEDGGEYEEKVHVFIYKYPPTDGAYADDDASNYWFSDFYSDASVYIYSSYLDQYRDGVEKGGYYDKFDGESIPVNIDLVPRF